MPERTATIPIQESVAWNIPQEFEGILKYNPRHDIQDYLDLKVLEGRVPPTEYADKLLTTNTRTLHNLEKSISERLFTASSTVRYYIDGNGRLRSEDYEDPVILRYQKGQAFLEANGSNESEREKAEIEGIREVERIFSNGQDAVLIIASPHSEGCRHLDEDDPQNEPEDILYHDNFFDVHVQKNGKITTTRYHSRHNYQGFFNAARSVDPNHPIHKGERITPADLLRRPAQTTLPLETILEKFAIDTRATDVELTEQVIKACTPLFLSYIQTLADNPLNIDRIKLTLNAAFNTADENAKFYKEQEKQKAYKHFAKEKRHFQAQTSPPPTIFKNIEEQIQIKGRQPVKKLSRGCPGKQNGFSVSSSLSGLSLAIGAQSVADFGSFGSTEDEDHSDFPCPRCGHTITYGAGIDQCPGCGLEATCA